MLKRLIGILLLTLATSSCTIIKSKSPTQGEKKIILTFDDGPSTSISNQLLDVLKKYQIKATFFYIGRNVEKSPQIVKRAWREGHELAIHSYDRDFPPFFKDKDLHLDIQKTQSAIEKAISEALDIRLYRPPRGLITIPVRNLIASKQFQLGYINFYAWDAGTNSGNYQKTLKKIKDKIQQHQGAAIVLHETRYKKNLKQDDKEDKLWLPQALEELILWGLENGYEFVLYP